MVTGPPSFSHSPHLVDLLAETDRLAALVAAAPAAARAALAPAVRARAVLASLRLDGSDLDVAPSDDAVAAARSVEGITAEDPQKYATWFEAMRIGEDLDPEHTAQLHALEYAGVVEADAATDLVDTVLTDPGAVLVELHRRLTRGLVAADRVGATRLREQAVHDASNGRILYFTVDPAAVPREVAVLTDWVRTVGTDEHGLIAAGVLHHELLRIHPFDAANGRLARAAARLVLRHRGLDPDGLAAPEPTLDGDRLGYADEVARTLRRRDLTIWLERWGEAVTDGLRRAARDLGALEADLPERSATFLAGRSEPFTVADLRDATGGDAADRRADLAAMLDAGRIRRVLGSRGLRFEVVQVDTTG